MTWDRTLGDAVESKGLLDKVAITNATVSFGITLPLTEPCRARSNHHLTE